MQKAMSLEKYFLFTMAAILMIGEGGHHIWVIREVGSELLDIKCFIS